MPAPRAAPSLKGRALRHLARREHSRAELERKLAEHEEVPGELARVLDDLESKGFIDARRVAESLVNRRAHRLGAARMRQELIAKGLDAGLVRETVEALRTTELARAREVWRSRFGAVATEAPERAKQMRFLAARGFAPDVIRKIVAEPDDD